NLHAVRIVVVQVRLGVIRIVLVLRNVVLLRLVVGARRERPLERPARQLRRIAIAVALDHRPRNRRPALPAHFYDVLLRRPHDPGFARDLDRERAHAADLLLVDLIALLLGQTTDQLHRLANDAVGFLVGRYGDVNEVLVLDLSL